MNSLAIGYLNYFKVLVIKTFQEIICVYSFLEITCLKWILSGPITRSRNVNVLVTFDLYEWLLSKKRDSTNHNATSNVCHHNFIIKKQILVNLGIKLTLSGLSFSKIELLMKSNFPLYLVAINSFYELSLCGLSLSVGF